VKYPLVSRGRKKHPAARGANEESKRAYLTEKAGKRAGAFAGKTAVSWVGKDGVLCLQEREKSTTGGRGQASSSGERGISGIKEV